MSCSIASKKKNLHNGVDDISETYTVLSGILNGDNTEEFKAMSMFMNKIDPIITTSILHNFGLDVKYTTDDINKVLVEYKLKTVDKNYVLKDIPRYDAITKSVLFDKINKENGEYSIGLIGDMIEYSIKNNIDKVILAMKIIFSLTLVRKNKNK